MRPLLWVSKSREKLAVALRAMSHAISANTGNRGKTPGGEADFDSLGASMSESMWGWLLPPTWTRCPLPT
jgi:hypothetical protein